MQAPIFFHRYRWEIVILLGIPFAGYVIGLALQAAVGLAVSTVGFPISDADLEEAWPLLRPVATLVLLLLTLPFVARQGRPLLTLLWGFTIATAAVTSIVAYATDALFGGIGLPFRPSVPPHPRALFLILAIFIVELWFLRRASRFGLVYALFLAYVGVFTFFDIYLAERLGQAFELLFYGSTRATAHDLGSALGIALSLPLSLVGAWLLGNFALRGARFRTLAVVAAISYDATLQFLLPLTLGVRSLRDGGIADAAFNLFTDMGEILLIIGLYIAIVYIVRVRRTIEYPEMHPPILFPAPTDRSAPRH